MMTKPAQPSKRNPLGALLLEYRWTLVGILAALSFLLGIFGIDEHYAAIGEPRSLLDTVYLAVQLFFLEFGDVGPFPWKMEVARFLSPLVLTFTALSALLAVFREQVQLLWSRWLSNHVVICGLGGKGLALTRSFRKAGYQVAIIEQDGGNRSIGIARDLGAVVLIGNASEPAYLLQARTNKAGYLFAVCNDDGVNAQIAECARELIRDRRRGVLMCLIHITTRRLAALLSEKDIAARTIDAFRLEFFSIHEQGARALMLQYPPFSPELDRPPEHAHILIVGLHNLGESLLVNIARRWYQYYGESETKLSVTVVDRLATQKWNLLLQQIPQLNGTCDADLHDMWTDSAGFNPGEFLFDADSDCQISQIYVCIADPPEALSVALEIRLLLKGGKIPIVVCMDHDTGLATLLEGKSGRDEDFDSLNAFGLLDQACTTDILTDTTHEILARAYHEDYVRQQSKSEDDPAMRVWDKLPETLRESNRLQADHIGEKLKTIGCEIRYSYDWAPAPMKIEDEEIEILAKMEHERFVNERKDDGWILGERNVDAKVSPMLKAWHELAHDEKLNDLMSAEYLPRFLAGAGFELYRVTSRPHTQPDASATLQPNDT